MYQNLYFEPEFVNYKMLNNRLQLYFPQIVQQIGWLLIIFSILLIIKAVPFPNQFLPVIFLVVGVVLSLTVEGTVLNLNSRMLKQYVGLFGIKVGRWKPLPSLTEVVLTSANYSQQVHSWVTRHDVRSKVYRGFLKGPEGIKILFASNRNPDQVKEHVILIAEALDIPATDYSIKPPTRLK